MANGYNSNGNSIVSNDKSSHNLLGNIKSYIMVEWDLQGGPERNHHTWAVCTPSKVWFNAANNTLLTNGQKLAFRQKNKTKTSLSR